MLNLGSDLQDFDGSGHDTSPLGEGERSSTTAWCTCTTCGVSCHVCLDIAVEVQDRGDVFGEGESSKVITCPAPSAAIEKVSSSGATQFPWRRSHRSVSVGSSCEVTQQSVATAFNPKATRCLPVTDAETSFPTGMAKLSPESTIPPDSSKRLRETSMVAPIWLRSPRISMVIG